MPEARPPYRKPTKAPEKIEAVTMSFLDELPDKRLLPTQRNTLARVATQQGFSVDAFEWVEEDMWEHHLNYTNSEGTVYPRFDKQYRVSVLRQKRSGHYCKFGPITLEYSPAKRTITDKRIFGKDSERLALFRSEEHTSELQ